MSTPVIRVGDMHVCPLVEPGPVPHTGGPALQGSPNILVNGLPAAHITSTVACVGPSDQIGSGSATVFFNGMPAASMTSTTAHGGKFITGSPDVFLGDDGASGPATLTPTAAKAAKVSSFADALVYLSARREVIEAIGYQPKYRDEELHDLAQNGHVGDERFQVRFMEETYLADQRNSPDVPLSGKLGTVIETKNGKGAKYWSTSFDQLEDADTDPRLISQKLGLPYDPEKKYALIIIDTQIATPLTGAKSIAATFGNLSEFVNTELPDDFPKTFTDKAMTPEYQAFYNQHYNAAVESGLLPKGSKDSKQFEEYLNTTDLSQAERDQLVLRMKMHDIIGNNQDYVGNGLTKNMTGVGPKHGAVETFNFERKEVNLQALSDAGAIHIIKGLTPL